MTSTQFIVATIRTAKDSPLFTQDLVRSWLNLKTNCRHIYRQLQSKYRHQRRQLEFQFQSQLDALDTLEFPAEIAKVQAALKQLQKDKLSQARIAAGIRWDIYSETPLAT
jgi:hypothetical protein